MRNDREASPEQGWTHHFHLEPLEPRLLLTAVAGGESFRFTDVNNQLIEVTVTGDALVELIGAATDGTNITIADLPGLFTDSSLGRAGEEFLLDGIDLIGINDILDGLFPQGNTAQTDGDDDYSTEINIQGLAAQEAIFGGNSYAFNVANIPNGDTDHLFVQLVQLDNADGSGTVEAMLQQATLGVDMVATQTNTPLGANPNASAFDPVGRLLYYVRENAGVSELYSMNRQTGETLLVGNISNGGTDLSGISAIGFDDAGQMYALTNQYDNDINADASGDGEFADFGILQVDKTTGAVTSVTDLDTITLANNPFHIAMTFDSDNGDFVVVQRNSDGNANTSSTLQRIDPNSGIVTNLGRIQVEGVDTEVDGLAFVTDADGTRILVGLDNGQEDEDNGTVEPRMIRISVGNARATLLSEAGVTGTVQGTFRDIAAVDETGTGQFVLYASNATDLYAGSAVTTEVNTAGESRVIAIEGADFRPVTGDAEDGLLYFVVEQQTGVDTIETVRDLYSINVSAGSYSKIQSSLTRVGRLPANITGLHSIAWDQTAADDARLLLAVSSTANGNPVEQVRNMGAITVNANTTNDIATANVAGNVTVLGGAALDLVGIDLIDDDPTAADNVVWGIMNGAEIEDDILVTIDLGSGVATPIGDLRDTDDGGAPFRGQSLEGLAWNPVITNPFTGGIGALTATDNLSDELVIIDTRFRAADQLAQIHVTHAEAGAQIFISAINVGQNGSTVVPFAAVDATEPNGTNTIISSDDDRFSLSVVNAQTGQGLTIGREEGLGGAYIGIKQYVQVAEGEPFEPRAPIVTTAAPGRIGMYAAGFDSDFNTAGDNFGAGMFVTENLLDFFIDDDDLGNRVMGLNLDAITALAVRRDLTAVDAIAVIDNDRVDETGTATGAEVGLIDPATGLAFAAESITDSLTGELIASVLTAAWGDLLFNGTEVLYAIADVNDPAPVDLSAQNIGGDLGGDFDFVGLSAGPTGVLFGINNNAGTFELVVMQDNGDGTVTPTTAGRIVVPDPTDVVDGFADMASVDAIDFDPTTGRLVLIGQNAAGNVALFTLLLTPQDVDGDFVAAELIAEELGELAPAVVPGDIVDIGHGLDGTLYGILDTVAGSDLVTITPGGAVTNLGALQIGGVTDLDLVGIDVDNLGQVLGVDAAAGRIVLIDIADPTMSTALTNPGTVSGNLQGYTSDGAGVFYGVETGAGNEFVFTSPGTTPTLGTINTTTGVFTATGSVDPLLQAAGVRTMAFAPLESVNIPGQQALYVVGNDGTLYEMDATTGVVVGTPDVISDGTPDSGGLDISYIAFNQFGTVLLAQDQLNGRLVDIDMSTANTGNVVAGANVFTADGTVRPTVGGIAYDFTNDRFLAVDNATGLVPLEAEGGAAESASLMILSGFTGSSTLAEINQSPSHQDFGDVMIGGVFTGQAYFSGSLNQFYAGQILTGLTSGELEFNVQFGGLTRPDNFMVMGDLRNLISGSHFGTHTALADDDPLYMSGFDLLVNGQAGQVWTLDSWLGTFDVVNDSAAPTIASRFVELEGRFVGPGSEVIAWFGSRLYDGSDKFFNDTFDTAQRVGTIRPFDPADPAGTIIAGRFDSFLDTDYVDYYAVSLMAGQTVELQLDPFQTLLPFGLALIDPDGRIVATNLNAVNSGVTFFEPFRYTTDRPGEYRIAIGSTADPTFTGQVPTASFSYQINVNQIGELALGGLHVNNNALAISGGTAYVVQNADLGAITSVNGSIWFDPGFFSVRDINVFSGNARSLSAGVHLGFYDPAFDIAFGGPRMEVRNGGIGLLRNEGRDDNGLVGGLAGASGLSFTTGDPFFDVAWVDGNIQYVDADGQAAPTLYTNAGAGVVRADRFTSGGEFRLNADETGNDGVLDLIAAETIYNFATSGDYGTIVSGGLPITTGAGGDVRYMRVDGTLWQDLLFFGGAYEPLELDTAVPFRFVDDSGGEIMITPDVIPNNRFNPNLPEDPVDNPRYLAAGNLTITSYQVRGSGGGVLLNVDISTPVTEVPSLGITFSSLSNGPTAAPVQVSSVTISDNAVGNAVTLDELSNDAVLGELVDPVSLTFTGPLPIEVMDITGTQIDRIVNTTDGEIVSITATSVGHIATHGALGVPMSHTGMLLNPRQTRDDQVFDTYPFEQQTTGINISGNVVSIHSDMGLGNLLLGGNVNVINANANGIDDDPNVVEGVVAPIFVDSPFFIDPTPDAPLTVNTIQIGEGVAPSGSGFRSRAGIYVVGQVGTVQNQPGGNIYGDLVAQVSAANPAGFNNIILRDGSIINTQIAVYTDLEMASVLGPNAAVDDFGNAVEGDPLEIGNIRLTGEGGIIGSDIGGGDIGNIDVSRGFGIFNTSITNIQNSTIGDVSTDGYGVLGTFIQAASSMDDLTARGRGDVLALGDFAEAIRHFADGLLYDPIFDVRLTSLTDVARAFNDAPDYQMVAGQINTSTVVGVVNLGNVAAHKILFSAFDFGNTIRSITTGASVDADPSTIVDVEVTTGALGTFRPGADVSGLTMTIAGELRSVILRGNFLGDSIIRAVGPNGNILNVRISGDLIGSLFATGFIGNVQIGGDLVGTITVDGEEVGRRNALSRLVIDGIFNGSVVIHNGDVGTIDVAGSFGDTTMAGDQLFIAGSLRALIVGDRRGATVSFLAADVIILGDVGRVWVFGQIGGAPGDADGDVFIAGNLDQLILEAHPLNAGGALLNNDFTVGGTLKRASVKGGDLGDGTALTLSVGDDLDRLDIVDGDIALGFVVRSIFGNIDSTSIRNGDLLGVLEALAGKVDRVDVRGSDMGAAASITAAEGGRFKFDGDLKAGAMIDIVGQADSLDVGGNIEAGAGVSFGGLQRLNVDGNASGPIEIGYTDRGTRIDINGDWNVAAGTMIDSDVDIDVDGDLTNGGGPLNLSRSAGRVTIDGDVSADVIVDSSGDRISFGSLTGAVIAFGQSVSAFGVGGAIANSLIQFGISAGDDGVFGLAAGDEDAGETNRMADVDRFDAGTITDSIIAAGGAIGRFMSSTMTTSSVSSGLVLGSAALRAVIDDATPLVGAGEQNAARTGANRALFHGEFDNATIRDGGLIGSYLTAGVNTTVGDFSAPEIVTSMTGGTSGFGSVSGILGAGSMIVADAGINSDRTTPGGGAINTSVGNATFIADITTGAGSPLQVSQGIATSGAPLNVVAGPGTFTVTVTGNGQAEVFDTVPGDGVIDAVVITGSDANTRVDITGGANYDISRILTDDDVTVRQVTFDGDIVGDGTDAVDLWIDGSIRTLEVLDLGDAVSGQVGGDANDVSIADQGAGRLYFGGDIRTLEIATGSGSPLQQLLGTYAGTVYNTLTFDAAGNLWAFNNDGSGTLNRLDPTLDGPGGILQTVILADAYSGGVPDVLGIDFLGGTLYGVARLYDPQPTQQLANTVNFGGGADLRGLAADAAGNVYAVDSINGVDELVMLDSATGIKTIVGQLRNPIGNSDFFQNVLAMTVDNSGNLLALVNDRDGNGGFDVVGDGVSLVEIATTAVNGFVSVTQIDNAAQKGVFLDGGGVLDTFTAMAVAADGTVYAIRRTGGVTDTLVSINPATGVITAIGNVEVNGGGAGITELKGLGFDADGNLVAYDDAGADGRLLYLDPVDLAANNADQFQELTVGNNTLGGNLDAFTIGAGANNRSYAFDTAGDGQLFLNPIDAADPQERVAVLGTINTATGAFDRLTTVSDANGNPVIFAQGLTNVPIAADAVNTDILIAGGGNLVNYDIATGAFTTVGPLEDSLARAVPISAMDFDSATNELIGIRSDQLGVVEIDPLTGLVTVRTNPGVVSAGLTGLAYDPTAAELFSYQDGTTDRFVQLRGDDEPDAGGLFARSIDRTEIGSPYNGRIVTTGNTFNRVTLNGDFEGTLTTPGDLVMLDQRAGDFMGVLNIGGDFDRGTFSGNITDRAIFDIGGTAGRIMQRAGDFAATFNAMNVQWLDLSGNVTADATFNIARTLDQLSADGAFNGMATFGDVSRGLMIDGLLGAGAMIDVTNDAGRIYLRGGTAAGSWLRVGGHASMLDVGMTHSGQVGVNLNLDRANFYMVNQGALYVGGYSRDLSVRMTTTDGLFAYGVQLGADGVFNTADDLISGGTLTSARFGNDFVESVLTAGVLPGLLAGPGIPADHTAFVRDAGAGDFPVTNPTEAGGLRRGRIERVSFADIIHLDATDPTTQPLIATSDGVDRVSARNGMHLLNIETHTDPFGAPQVLSSTLLTEDTIRIIFTEPLNTDSLVLSTVLGDAGTVIVTQGGALVTELTLVYSEQTTPEGDVLGVLDIVRAVPYDPSAGQVSIELVGTGATAIVDRSGLRSSLRIVNDPAGTLLDGNGDGAEGGNFMTQIGLADLANDFDLAPLDVNIALDTTTLISDDFSDVSDVDIFTFDLNAGEFFAFDYDGSSQIQLAAFVLDDQGTVDTSDDTYEMLARWERSADDAFAIQAFEAPVTGEYFVALVPDAFGGTVLDETYSVRVYRSSDENMLATAFGGAIDAMGRLDIGGGNVQHIAYVSNAKRVSKQLVYLNFDGGTSTQTALGTVNFDALDAGIYSPLLTGQTDRLINGGSGVTGILENMETIFNSYPAAIPADGAGTPPVDVQFLNGDLTAFNVATDGLFFTTTDPALSGLDPATDFTTMFVGQSDAFSPGLLGIASEIDVAGLEIANEAIILAENFAGFSIETDATSLLNDYSLALANVTSHELVHTLGFNHQGTNTFDWTGFEEYQLIDDDPNNDGDATDGNGGEYGIIMAGPVVPLNVFTSELGQFGTADLTDAEFPVGQIDTAQLLIWWFS